MGLRNRLARAAVSRAHVLVVATPSAFTTRVVLERALLARGWVQADSPADADVLAVCGREYAGLTEALGVVWEAMPGPRVRVDVVDRSGVPSALDRAADQLLDTARHIRDAGHRAPVGAHQDHGGMDIGDMEMAPAGIPLAGGAEDRDGLEMDVLHLPLGPVLPHWPPGLVVQCTMHGDVVTDVMVELLAEPTSGHGVAQTPDDPGFPVARTCDAVVSVLALAGWPVGEALARRARDACLDGEMGEAAHHLERLRRDAAGSWLLRWMLRGVGRTDVESARGCRGGRQMSGDVYDRLFALVDSAEHTLRGEAAPDGGMVDPVDVLPAQVNGLELASVRLVVASLGLDFSPSPVRVRDA